MDSPPTPTPQPAAQPDAGALGDAPLSPNQLRLLGVARSQRTSVRTAAGLAAFNGWSLLLTGVGCVLAALLGLGSVWLGLWLCAFGGVELYGRGLLKDFDPRAARVLAANEVLLLLAILAYCAVSAYRGLSGDLSLTERLGEYRDIVELMRTDRSRSLEQEMQWVTDTYRRAVGIFYGTIALTALGFQGGCAYYYYTREPALRALRATPPWVRALLALD